MFTYDDPELDALGVGWYALVEFPLVENVHDEFAFKEFASNRGPFPLYGCLPYLCCIDAFS